MGLILGVNESLGAATVCDSRQISSSFFWCAFVNGLTVLHCCDFGADNSEFVRSLVGELSHRDPSSATDLTAPRYFFAPQFAITNLYLWQCDRVVCQPK